MKKNGNVLKIKEIMEYYRLNQTELSAKTGIPQTNISEMLRGKRGCGDINLAKIGKAFPEINPLWLINLSETMFKASAPSVMQNNVNGDNNYITGNNNNVSRQPQPQQLPAVCIEVECPKCGEVIEVANNAILPLVPPEVTRAPNVDIESFRHNRPQEMDEVDLRQVWGKGVFLMKVDTRAMEPEYREGSYLVLRKLPGLSYARPDGSAYVIDTMLPHTLFRYLSKERDGTYKLSANRASNRDPLYLQAEDIQHIYDIVGSFRVGR